MVDERPESDDASGEGRILAPEELDITESEYVEELEEGRFVVSPDGPPTVPSGEGDGDTEGGDTGDSGADAGTDEPVHPSRRPRRLTEATVHRWLRRRFAAHDSRYAFDVTATFDGRVSQRRMASNDVVTSFESLVLWYAQEVDGETPVEDVLSILLAESNVPVRYPTGSVRRLINAMELSPDDSIADLLEAVEDG